MCAANRRYRNLPAPLRRLSRPCDAVGPARTWEWRFRAHAPHCLMCTRASASTPADSCSRSASREPSRVPCHQGPRSSLPGSRTEGCRAPPRAPPDSPVPGTVTAPRQAIADWCPPRRGDGRRASGPAPPPLPHRQQTVRIQRTPRVDPGAIGHEQPTNGRPRARENAHLPAGGSAYPPFGGWPPGRTRP